jgi:cytochrome d ubiquinol oxidase subunit I
VGAVSGTVLSFELGLLWPSFMGTFGEAVGLPFALEGYAFFTEAIFLSIYLYGRNKIHGGVYLFAGRDGGGERRGVRVLRHPGQRVHEHAARLPVGGRPDRRRGAVAGMLLRHPTSGFHHKALGIALGMAVVTALLQPVSGDVVAGSVARHQPLKLAAMEAHYRTETRAPLRIGGWPDDETGEVSYALEIPGGLSLLAFHDLDAEVKGLDDFPRDLWPPVAATHGAFQLMVGAGTAIALFALVAVVLAVRRRGLPTDRWFLRGLVLCAPLGVLAMEAGWFVTELGRQPWVVRGFMLTRDAVTPFPHLAAPFWLFTCVYLFLGVVVVVLLKKQILATGPRSPSPGAPSR